MTTVQQPTDRAAVDIDALLGELSRLADLAEACLEALEAPPFSAMCMDAAQIHRIYAKAIRAAIADTLPAVAA
jgi:hypothetical protein